MTKAELIKELEAYPDNMEIFAHGFDAMYNEAYFYPIVFIKGSSIDSKGREVLVEEDKDKNAIILY